MSENSVRLSEFVSLTTDDLAHVRGGAVNFASIGITFPEAKLELPGHRFPEGGWGNHWTFNQFASNHGLFGTRRNS